MIFLIPTCLPFPTRQSKSLLQEPRLPAHTDATRPGHVRHNARTPRTSGSPAPRICHLVNTGGTQERHGLDGLPQGTFRTRRMIPRLHVDKTACSPRTGLPLPQSGLETFSSHGSVLSSTSPAFAVRGWGKKSTQLPAKAPPKLSCNGICFSRFTLRVKKAQTFLDCLSVKTLETSVLRSQPPT